MSIFTFINIEKRFAEFFIATEKKLFEEPLQSSIEPPKIYHDENKESIIFRILSNKISNYSLATKNVKIFHTLLLNCKKP